MPGRRLWLAIVFVALGLRVALALQGGQFFFPDEARYNVSREAAALIMEGKWRQGVALPFEGGDHVGFKFLGILPALLEPVTNGSSWLPGIFWSMFSAGSVLLIGLLPRRLGGPPGTAFWCILAAATSATLFHYSRHLLPYDASMFFALSSLYMAVGGVSLMRALGAGVLAGSAFAIYYGYWPLVGAVLVWGSLHGPVSWWWRLARGAMAGSGAMAVIAAAWAIDQAWGGNHLFERARAFSGTINQGDYQASLATWAYLFRVEGVWICLAVGLGAVLVRRWWNLPAVARTTLIPGIQALATAVSIWLLFILTGDVLHKFTVYGRLVRQMLPFLSLGLGFGAAVWVETRPSAWKWTLASLLVAHAAWQMGQAMRLQFPDTFMARWEPVVSAHQRETADPGAYYRFVNVTRYIHEVETLRRPPAETIAATRHPLSFAPYSYELFDADERRHRRASDQRMRAVKVEVPAENRVQGLPYGRVSLKIRFKPAPPGSSEPLLSVGPYRAGELFFVQYLAPGQVRFGCEIMGLVVVHSQPMAVEADRTYQVVCFSSSLLPPDGDDSPEWAPARQAGVKNQLLLAIDGQPMIQQLLPANRGLPAQVYAGANPISADSAGAEFSGDILEVRRGGFPEPFVPGSALPPAYGAVKLRLSPPTSLSSRPEPLLVVGELGRAVLAFIVPLPDGRVQLGADIWGVGAPISEPLRLRGDNSDEVLYEFGTLFPPEGDAAWGGIAPAVQADRRGHLRIRVNGRLVLEAATITPELGPAIVVVGENPVGGSYVGQVYSGKVLLAERIGLLEADRGDGP